MMHDSMEGNSQEGRDIISFVQMSHDEAEELNNWLHSTQLMFECETSAYHHACHDITG